MFRLSALSLAAASLMLATSSIAFMPDGGGGGGAPSASLEKALEMLDANKEVSNG